MKKKIIWSTALALSIFSLLTIVSCTGDYELPEPPIENTDNSCIISMRVPLTEIPTRAMSTSFEKMIDENKLSFLVFKKETDNSESYVYSAPIGESELKSDGTIEYKLKLIQDKEGDSRQSRIVVIANHSTTTGPALGVKKDVYLKTLKFPYTAKWENDMHIPMWGETDFFNVLESSPTQKQHVKMLRALAKIDVGLKFKNIPTSEEVDGLENFKLKSVSVYRMFKEGYVVPFEGEPNTNIVVQKPTISGISDKFADVDRLFYELDNAGDSYIREIYVPETNASSAAALNDRACLVIGGYYGAGNISTLSYYRLDLTTGNTSPGAAKYFNILRNHRYRVNISKVTGPGFPDEEDALNSVPSDIVLDIIPWEEQITHTEVVGKFHFGITDREPTADYPENSVAKLSYYTNIPDLVPGDIKIEFENTPQTKFDVSIDVTTKEVIFTAKGSNVSEAYFEENCTLKVKGIFEIPLVVKQKNLEYPFTFVCEATSTMGIVFKNIPLTPEKNTIRVRVKKKDGVTFDDDITVKLVSDEVGGIKYAGSGEFKPNDEYIDITMTGSGITDEINVKTLTITEEESKIKGNCIVKVRTALRKKRVAVLTSEPGNAWSLGNPNSGAYKVLFNKTNFGTEEYSKVPLEALTMKVFTPGQVTALKAYNPQVILSNYPLYVNEALSDFLYTFTHDNKGAIVYLQQTEGSLNYKYIAKLLGDGTVISMNSTIVGGDNDVFKITTDDDMITNGPFGDVRGKYWGQDQGPTLKFIFNETEMQKVYVYSYGQGKIAASNNQAKNPSMLRLKDYHLFWAGDGGFASVPSNGYSSSPIAWPAAGEADPNNPGFLIPIPKSNYGAIVAERETVWNSIIFCNAVTWALERAEYDSIIEHDD